MPKAFYKTHHNWNYIMDDPQLFVASFTSHRYPEDSCILGIYSSSDKAESRIEEAMKFDKFMFPKYPRRYQQNRMYYDINVRSLDEDII